MKLSTPIVAILLAAGFTGPQALAQDRPLTLSERVARMEQQVGGGGGGMTAELVMQINALQAEVRRLRGEVEQLSHQLEGVKARQRDQYLDLDRRLQALSGKAGTGYKPERATSAPNPIRVEEQEAGSSQPRPEPESEPPTARAEPAPRADAEPVPPADLEAQEAAYSAAKNLLLQERFAESAAAFREFLQKYPRGPLSDNAQYWLGESYYVTGNFDLALNAFQAVLSQFPESRKRADAMLKMGYTYYELEQLDQAREILNQVIDTWPDTSEARLAQSRLRLMRIQTANLPE